MARKVKYVALTVLSTVTLGVATCLDIVGDLVGDAYRRGVGLLVTLAGFLKRAR